MDNAPATDAHGQQGHATSLHLAHGGMRHDDARRHAAPHPLQPPTSPPAPPQSRGGNGYAAARGVLARPRAPSKKLLRPRQHTNILLSSCRTRRYKEGGCGLERDVRIPCARDVDDVMNARRPLDQQVLLATCNRQASGKRLVMTVRVPEAQPEGRLVARAQGRGGALETRTYSSHAVISRRHC